MFTRVVEITTKSGKAHELANAIQAPIASHFRISIPPTLQNTARRLRPSSSRRADIPICFLRFAEARFARN